MSDDMQSRLQDYCARAMPGRHSPRVGSVARMNPGWESDIYAFDVEHGPTEQRQHEKLILRVYHGDDAETKAAHEFDGLGRLRRAGYPVPRVVLVERERSLFGKPFVIMERIEGRVLWPILFSAPGERQPELLTLFCELLVRLHALDWRAFVSDMARYEGQGPYAFIDQWLSEAHAALERFPPSGFSRVLQWLEARRDQVPCQRPSPIHWDYHPGNVLLRDDGSAVVIDWTQIGASDSRFDLAWTLLLTSSHQGVEWRGLILKEYERLAGVEVEQIEYFDVAACLKRLGSVAASLTFGPEKLGMRPGAQAHMRRQMPAFKAVYALMLERTGIRVTEVESLFASLS